MMLTDHTMAWSLPLAKGASADIELMMAGLLPLLALLLAAVRSDLRERRIPNQLVVAGIVAGLVLHTLLPAGNGFLAKWPGGIGPWGSLQGLAIGAAAMFPLYFLRAMGAGDVKLMAAVGAILGPEDIVPAVLGTFLAGGVVSLVVALSLGSAGQMFRNVFYMVHMTWLKVALPGRPVIEPPVQSVGRAPYAVAVAFGTLGGVLWAAAGANSF